MFERKLKTLWALIICLWIAVPAVMVFARNQPLSEEWLFTNKDAMVTATNLLQTIKSEAPGTAYLFNRNVFKRYSARRLEDVLPYVPGIQTSQYLKHDLQYRFRGVHNGRFNDKILLLIDGVPFRNVYYSHFSLDDRIPLEMIESMEIILGPGSSLYGANAFAGVISLKTLDFTDDRRLSITSQAGSFRRLKSIVSFTSPNLVLFTSGMDRNTHRPLRVYDGTLFSHSRDEDLENAFLKFRDGNLTGWMNWTHYEFPYIYRKAGREASIMVQPMSFGAEYRTGSMMKHGEFMARGFHLWDKDVEYETRLSNNARTYEDQTSSLMGLDARWSRRLSDRHTVVAGGSWLQDASHGISITGGNLLEGGRQQSNDNYAVFLQDQWTPDEKLTATLGLRFDDFDRFDDSINYRVALVRALSSRGNLKLMHGTAVRIPSYREYAKDMEDTSFVQPPVNSERMMTTEFSYNHSSDHSYMELTLFSNEFKNFLDDKPTPPTADDPAGGADEYFYNSPELITMRGVEASLDRRLGPRIELRATLALLDTNRLGHTVADMAKVTGSIVFNYQFNKDNFAGFNVLYKSKRGDMNDAVYPDDQQDAHVLFNFHAAGNLFGPNWKFRLGVDNLSDEKVFDGLESDWLYNSQEPGREFWAEVQWTSVF